SRIEEAARGTGLGSTGGVLFDLGVSSMQLESEERGFGYRTQGPLDMRMGPGEGDRPTAAEVVNSYPEPDLTRVISGPGDERYARRIARAIARARSRAPIATTGELA